MGTVSCPSLCLPEFSPGCPVMSPSPYLLPQRTFPRWGRGLGTEELSSRGGQLSRKVGSFRYQRGAGSQADPELALCLGSLMLSTVWLSYVSTPGCGPLSGWPCQPGVRWSLEKPQQDLQNGISFCPCSLSVSHTHTPSVNSVSSAQWSLEQRIHRRLFYLVPASRALCF